MRTLLLLWLILAGVIMAVVIILPIPFMLQMPLGKLLSRPHVICVAIFGGIIMVAAIDFTATHRRLNARSVLQYAIPGYAVTIGLAALLNSFTSHRVTNVLSGESVAHGAPLSYYLQRLRYGDGETRRRAVNVLVDGIVGRGKGGQFFSASDQLVPILEDLLINDKDVLIRRRCARAAQSARALRSGLTDPDLEVRQATAERTCKAGVSALPVLGLLVDAFLDRSDPPDPNADFKVRNGFGFDAIMLLGVDAIPRIQHHLANTDSRVRTQWAIILLRQIAERVREDAKLAKPTLESAMTHPDALIRREASEGLAAIRGGLLIFDGERWVRRYPKPPSSQR